MNNDLENILATAFDSDQPGGSVLITRGEQVLLRRGCGMADMEMDIPAEADMVFRIGSVTKQFTSVAILMLMEQGKLDLQAPLSQFLPDYPRGSEITIEHLLTHTSGIKNYTDIETFWQHSKEDITVQQLIELFENQPADFDPGAEFAYSNSGYVLLGFIIEKVSGVHYEKFLVDNIFKPLAMLNTYYDKPLTIIKRRARGYEPYNGGIINAQYISTSQPYAAGALASTVDDLLIWNPALDNNTLIKAETFERAKRPFTFNNGAASHYGYGWRISDYRDSQISEHGGGINGFICHALRAEPERILVLILTNGMPKRLLADVSFEILCILLGKPYEQPKFIKLPEADLQRHVGQYQFGLINADVSLRQNQLCVTGLFPNPVSLNAISGETFAFADAPYNRINFQPEQMQIKLRGGVPLLANRVSEQ